MHEESAVKFCDAMTTLTEGIVKVHVNNFTDQPYKLEEELHTANISVMVQQHEVNLITFSGIS